MSTAEDPHRERLRAFFSGLTPAIRVATEAQRRLDRVAATQFSVFEYFQENENLISGIFADLLRPDGTHGQGTRFLELFLKEIDRGKGKGEIRKRADYEPLAHARVYTEYPTSEGRRIDIVLKLDNKWIGVENKPWAGEQPEQLQHYLDFLTAPNRDPRACILYLSGAGDDAKSIQDVEHYLTIPYGHVDNAPSVAHWIGECQSRCESDRVRWFLKDMHEYITRMFYTDVTLEEDAENE